jgi:hypothetical protein
MYRVWIKRKKRAILSKRTIDNAWRVVIAIKRRNGRKISMVKREKYWRNSVDDSKSDVLGKNSNILKASIVPIKRRLSKWISGYIPIILK